MLKKLQSLYPNSVISNQKPEDYFSRYHWFSHKPDEWIGIPKQDLLEEPLEILKTLFDYHHTAQNSFHTSALAHSWYMFLYENGPVPSIEKDILYRFIHFRLSNSSIQNSDFDAALQAFFDSDIIITWENEFKGVIIEPKEKHFLLEKDFIAMYETLQSDFYIEPYLYIGKFRPITDSLLHIVQQERALLDFAYKNFSEEKIFHFEKLAPKHIALHLPEILELVIQNDILPVFKEDRELFTTMKSFLQNNMNASITAKKLFIHRNTLQYRLDKFSERTGIPLKDFYSAMTVYMACILFENEE
jgi:DNA-binding PucR family transcriptional regulator